MSTDVKKPAVRAHLVPSARASVKARSTGLSRVTKATAGPDASKFVEIKGVKVPRAYGSVVNKLLAKGIITADKAKDFKKQLKVFAKYITLVQKLWNHRIVKKHHAALTKLTDQAIKEPSLYRTKLIRYASDLYDYVQYKESLRALKALLKRKSPGWKEAKKRVRCHHLPDNIIKPNDHKDHANEFSEHPLNLLNVLNVLVQLLHT